jgi:hypothetical protein
MEELKVAMRLQAGTPLFTIGSFQFRPSQFFHFRV